MGKSKRRKSVRNARNKGANVESANLTKAPHSFVINRGKLGKNASELMLNFRKIMEPFTASQLKVHKQNVLKDFVHMAGPLNVTHLVIFTKTGNAMYMRIAKLPRGPTLTYQINEYSLIRDIISSQKKSMMYEKLFEHHPLLVLNNFSGEGMHFKLMVTMFQNMFPSIAVNKTDLNTIRRCLLLNYNDENTIDLRHYAIKIVPTGISKAVKKLIQSKVPNLSHYQNIDEFMQKSGNLSESEIELETPANTVVLSQPISSRGNITSEKSAVRLYEIGPRIKFQLIKIEEGLMTGEVIYHSFFKRTPEEIKALKEKFKAQKLLKEKRRAEQKRNVEKKKMSEEERKLSTDDEDNDREADRKWYREEVGEEPDESILPALPKKRKNVFEKSDSMKRRKISNITKKSEKSQETKTLQEFLKRRKKRKESKQAKKKSKQISKKVLHMKAKQNRGKNLKK